MVPLQVLNQFCPTQTKKNTSSILQTLKSFQDMQLPPPERREGPLEKRSKGGQIRVEALQSVIELREGILVDSFGVNGVKLRQRILDSEILYSEG